MFRIKLLFSFLVFSIFSNIAQNNSVKTLNITNNITTNNFDFLKEELKNVQVVMLGEKTHNDGNVFELKSNIIKYLHSELGFNTIAFESGTFELFKAQEEINNGLNVSLALRNSLFNLWTDTKEFKILIDFLKKNKSNIKLYGFDNQITGLYGEENLIPDLYSYCKKYKLTLDLNQSDLELLVDGFKFYQFDDNDISELDFKKALNSLLIKINKEPNSEIHFYWKQIINNLLKYDKLYFNNLRELIKLAKLGTVNNFEVSKYDFERDKQMAINLLGYIKQHPKEKIICWGANAHFVNDVTSINHKTINEFVPMGSYVKTKLKDKVYSLALITAEDSIYREANWHKPPVNKKSFESYLNAKKQAFIFISSKQKAMKKKMLNRFFSPFTFIEARLDLLHDGYIYLDTITPATFINTEELKNTITVKKDKNRINGQVIDATTKKPLAFVNILVNGTSLGTSTDYEGDFELYSPNSLENKEIVFSTIGYANKTILVENLPNKIELFEEVNTLDEIQIYGKQATIAIVKEAIKKIKDNYPSTEFNSTFYANSQFKIDNNTLLDFDMVSEQYDRNYMTAYRPTQNIQSVRWNMKNISINNKLHQYFWGFNNSVVYGNFLHERKYKKFNFFIEKEILLLGKEVYVISFSTDRNAFNYTSKMLSTNYSGLIYINKKDKAIIKTIENWKFTEDFSKIQEKGKFTKKYLFDNYTTMRLENNYKQNKDGLYYLNNAVYEVFGEVKNVHTNEKYPFKQTNYSFWYNIRTKDVKKIKFKEEKEKINKAKYDKKFWDNYQFPLKFDD